VDPKAIAAAIIAIASHGVPRVGRIPGSASARSAALSKGGRAGPTMTSFVCAADVMIAGAGTLKGSETTA
jgi:hypothetical protein